MPFFQPDFTRLCYRDLTADFLREQGICVLLLDIDNTLAPYEQLDPDDHIRSWLNSLNEAGIKTALLSNNHGDRMERFNKDLGQPGRSSACKPLPFRGKKMMRALGGTKKTTALMGDQIFTDVLCAHFSGARAILVPPIWDKRDAGTRFKRWLEKGILRRYYKKHKNAPDVRLGNPITDEIREKLT